MPGESAIPGDTGLVGAGLAGGGIVIWASARIGAMPVEASPADDSAIPATAPTHLSRSTAQGYARARIGRGQDRPCTCALSRGGVI